MTQILKIHEKNPERRHINSIVNALEEGNVVLVPTVTGYCFIGDSTKESTHSIFLTLRKGHPKNKPFSLVCKDISQASQISSITTQIFRIATRILPGPFTLILNCNKNTPKIAAGPKRKTVGIRICSHPVLKAIMDDFQKPLLITSVTDEEELISEEYFDTEAQLDSWWTNPEQIVNRIPKNTVFLALENDQPVPMKISTIIDFTGEEPTVVREGQHENHEKLSFIYGK